MEVTRKNFPEVLPEIRSAIESAHFFAIDTEFTGITSDRNIFPFDTPEEVYHKTVENSSEFIIIQLGLCAFRIENDEKLLYKCYNFYTYPCSRTNGFSCQGESIRFLADNNFDFNKLFREGVSYCNSTEEEKLRLDLKERQKYRANFSLAKDNPDVELVSQIPVPPEEQQLIEETSQKIDKFLQSDDKDLVIESRNAFQRKLIYQMIEGKYAYSISTSTVSLENNAKAILIERKRSEEEERLLEEERIKKEEDDLTNSIGLSLVLKELSKSRKLIIGHNMLLDLLYIIKQFFNPLPSSFEEFKRTVHGIFPLLCDTKYMCASTDLKPLINSSVLPHLFQTIQKKPFALPKADSEQPEHQYSVDNPKEHEAGYDAYLTGLCFIALGKYLKVEFDSLTNWSPIKSLMNKIFLLRVSDVNYINMSGREPTVSRDHIFYVTFPDTWKQSDIISKFKNFGSVYISWASPSSAFVSLNQREMATVVVKNIGHWAGFTISTFNQFKLGQQELRRKRKLHADSFENEKKEEKEQQKTMTSSSKNKKKKHFNDNDNW